ncbi:PREDICTED: uncharacterized protein LOC109207268 [Nicotiana attenuata]|uniref:uncharacterized protein LOC109207268 n=1 Tax=Nicotiana attenuata TaxID=49451 RepID=UPI00090547EE|nr:PREDICTED: uncharacterized protein LOC109207268 [Nicotiana attenuata]
MAKYDEEGNPFADIDEYIEDTNSIVPPRVDAATFKVEHGLILMLKAEGFFRNSTDDDPTQHLRNFLGVCALHKQNNILRLRVFKYSQAGEARKWIQNLPPNSIHSWGLDGMNQSIAKNAADGSFMDKTFARITQVLDKMAKHNQAWHSEDTTGGIAYGTPSLTNMIKENQQRDQVIVGLATNINVLTKMYTESQTKKVNVVEDVQPTSNEDYEEANYVNNSQGGNQRQPYQGSGQQNQWRSNPQGQSNQQWRNDQVGDANERSLKRANPKQKGTLPSDTIPNPKGSGSSPTSHCMEITTRSGKILQGENEQVVEVEDSEQEVEAHVEVPDVVEAEKSQKRKVDDSKLEKFYDILKQLPVNFPFVDALQEMLGFAKYLKHLITKKKSTKNEVVNVTHRFISIIATTTIQKKEDPGAFTISYTIGVRDFARALCDNGASINLMPLSIYKQAGLSMPRSTSMRLQMVDRSIKRPVGIVDDVLVKVGMFLLPASFVILDCAVDKEIPIILGRPFLAIGKH